MSRLAKKPIEITQGVTITRDGDIAIFKGAKGEIRITLPQSVEFRIEGENLWVDYKGAKIAREIPKQGTFWSHAKNAVEGVSKGFEKILEIEGVGYRAQIEGKDLVLFLGYALPVRFPVRDGVKVEVEKNVIKVTGVSKELVGQVAAQIRAYKKPEPYKGKGIHYRGEIIRRKVGKKAGAAAA